MEEIGTHLAEMNLHDHDRYKADQYRNHVYTANNFGEPTTASMDPYTQGIYGTSHLGDFSTTPSKVDAYKAAVYAANPALFEQKSATDSYTQGIYDVAHLGDVHTTPAHVNEYRSAIYASNPAAFEQKAATDSHTQAVYATANLGDLNIRPSDVNPYKAAIYTASPETFGGKAATDGFTSGVYAASHLGDMAAEDGGELTAKSKIDAYAQDVYATAHLGDARTHPATINEYKSAIYQTNPEAFSSKAVSDSYTSGVYSTSHLGDMVAPDAGELSATGKIDAHARGVYQTADLTPAPKSTTHAYTQAVYSTAQLGDFTVHPVKINQYKAAIYQTNPQSFSNEATTHSYTAGVYATSHLGDLAMRDNGDLTAKGKVNAYTQGVYGIMAGEAMQMEMSKPKLNSHRLGVYTAAYSDMHSQLPAERSRVTNSYRTAVYATAREDMTSSAKFDIDEETTISTPTPLAPNLMSESKTSLAKFATQLRHRTMSAGVKQLPAAAPSMSGMNKTLHMSVENLTALAKTPLPTGMNRSSSSQSLVDMANQKAMERSAMEDSPMRGRPQRVGHLGMIANLQKFAS